MVKKDFPIFDCDSHVVEPPEIWDEYVPSAIRSWEALELMEKHRVPPAVQRKLLGENARRLYRIDPVTVVTERIEQHEPAKLPW